MPLMTSLQIEGYRQFEKLSVDGLTRFNLVVGKNNSGKSSLLDAVVTLQAQDTARAIIRDAAVRGEVVELKGQPQLDLRHLFRGHEVSFESSFTLTARGGQWNAVTCTYRSLEKLPEQARVRLGLRTEDLLVGGQVLQIDRAPEGDALFIPLMSDQTISRDVFKALASPPNTPGVLVVGISPMPMSALRTNWDAIALTDAETMVVEALRLVEPRIERIAFVGAATREDRSVVTLKVRGENERVPLASMGEGLARVLHLALPLVQAKGRTFVADEIDTGLHYSVMGKVLLFILQTARELDVQVFATTHSEDCVRALAWVAKTHPELAPDISLHRLEQGQPETVRYGADELIIAAERQFEVR